MEFNQLFFYSLIQRFSSIFFLVGISELRGSSFINFGRDFNLLLIFSLCFKLGLFPVHSWFYKVSLSFSWFIFFILLSLNKILPIVYLFIIPRSLIEILLVFNFSLGTFFIFKRLSLKEFFVSASLYGIFWIYLSWIVSINFFFLFISIYFLFLYLFIWGYQESSPYLILISFTFLSGLPPLSLFYFKILILDYLYSISNVTLIFLIFVLTYFSLFSYYNFLKEYILSSFSLYSQFFFSLKYFFLHFLFVLLLLMTVI